MKTSSGHSILGWGYEGRTPDELVADAQAWGVQVVVDVRLTPLSRKAGFSKRALNDRLALAGIEYRHLPALGNPRDNRAGFADTTGAAGRAARDRFQTEVLAVDAAAAALDDVLELTRETSVLLLCFEAHEGTCHRRPILDALIKRDRLTVPV